jgi:serine/threonine-protein kinase
MSPEQLRGDELGPATDLYSVGVVTYQMVTGRLPFASDANLGPRILEGRFAPPQTVRVDCPVDFDAFIAKSMARDHRLRFSTAAEMAAALESALATPVHGGGGPPPREAAAPGRNV